MEATRLTWDVDGQLSTMQRENQEGEPRNTRTHLWNENDQMAMFISDEGAGYYGYDGNGERAYKLTGYTYKDNYNAGEETTRVMLNDVVLYANPYFIVTPKGYTKHYYNGSQRLASVVGDIQSLPNNMVKDGDNDKSKTYMKSILKKPLVVNSTPRFNVALTYVENLLKPILSKEKVDTLEYILKDNTYFYHGDHLGSMSWITDGSGDIIEHRRYLPYGEEWYHKRFNESYTERFTFTGKERDEESGYDYFGARYYDSRLLTSWLSIDRKAKANESPYLYCSGNPLKYTDPNGETPRIYTETQGFGHAFITTGEGKNTEVYTYGRYLGGGKGKSSANSTDPIGKGVLVHLTGEDAQKYIQHETNDKGATSFEITDASDDLVNTYFNDIFSAGQSLNNTEANRYDNNPNNFGTSDDARVIDDYNLFDNNCVSKTIEGAKAGGTKNDFQLSPLKIQPKSPRGLELYLKNDSKQNNSVIKDVTNE